MSDKERFEDIIYEIESLLEEAVELLNEDMKLYSRAKSYWYANMIVNLNHNHGFLSNSSYTMEDTLNEFIED
jgi:hypothetical protein